MRIALSVLVFAALLLAACDGEADGGPPPTLGPPVSVDQALQAEPGQEVQVQGYLFVDPNDTVTIADAIAESYPPQPGGARMTVENLDLAPFTLTDEGGNRWSDGPVTIVGTVEGDTLTVTSQG